MPARTVFALTVLATCGLTGCGSGDGEGPATTSAKPAPASATPALARVPKQPGELLFTAETSPTTSRPFELDGRYVVRFEQIAPEDPNLDFSGQTPFTAALQRRAGDPEGAVKLFGTATARGSRALTLRGRYVLDVSFGDFPYAVRFTPRR
ncbi:MAG: hypothetical protein H0W96_05175 [Solirubrobacterales bacterium]|nr:hypothetical protein [Solirubrobacterales bacterium]